jgi:aspartate/methionine/tyrosine aminotransferase
MRLSPQLLALGTESAFHVLAEARRLEAMGRRIIHLELGEPDFPIYASIVAAAGARSATYQVDPSREGVVDVDQLAAGISPRNSGYDDRA